MTAKQALRERVDRLTEEEAADILDLIEWELSNSEELTEEETAGVMAGREEIAHGDAVESKEFFRQLRA